MRKQKNKLKKNPKWDSMCDYTMIPTFPRGSKKQRCPKDMCGVWLVTLRGQIVGHIDIDATMVRRRLRIACRGHTKLTAQLLTPTLPPSPPLPHMCASVLCSVTLSINLVLALEIYDHAVCVLSNLCLCVSPMHSTCTSHTV